MNFLSLTDERLKHIKFFIYLCAGAFVLIMVRLVLPIDSKFLFLLWNLFLAFVPLGISSIMVSNLDWVQNPVSKGILGVLWLLFFPNAPYILTDYIHVVYGGKAFFLLNFITWAYFAILAFCAAILSLNDISGLLLKKMNKHLVSLMVFIICILSGFGIYLGRDLRFNSWDVITKPQELIHQSMNTINRYEADLITWFAAFSISILLFAFYTVLRIKKNPEG